jgi:hypothetical protein
MDCSTHVIYVLHKPVVKCGDLTGGTLNVSWLAY